MLTSSAPLYEVESASRYGACMRIRLCCAHVCVLSGGELCMQCATVTCLAGPPWIHLSSCHGQRCSTHPTHNAPRLPTLARLRGEALLLKLIHRDARTPSARCRGQSALPSFNPTSIRCLTAQVSTTPCIAECTHAHLCPREPSCDARLNRCGVDDDAAREIFTALAECGGSCTVIE
jgi:hypothetical protein